MSSNTNGITTFTSRRGGFVFATPTPTNGSLSLVNNWHAKTFGYVPDWYTEHEGDAHEPTWIVVPILINQKNPKYKGYGKTITKAKEDSATKIMNSGHC